MKGDRSLREGDLVRCIDTTEYPTSITKLSDGTLGRGAGWVLGKEFYVREVSDYYPDSPRIVWPDINKPISINKRAGDGVYEPFVELVFRNKLLRATQALMNYLTE